MEFQELRGKIALITGATKGIGKATVLTLAQAGVDIAAVARNQRDLQELEKEVTQYNVRYVYLAADVGEETEIKRIAGYIQETFGKIDILINNAGYVHKNIELAEMEPSIFRKSIEVNLIAPALLIQAVIPLMTTQGEGNIINISSIGGRKGGKGRSGYRAAKAGIINLTESVAAELERYNIRVNCICPSATDTEGFRDMFGENAMKTSSAQDIANVVLFLLSNMSTAVTGTSIDAFGPTNPLFNN